MKGKTGLVLEGGAMRGMFTCGILDVWLENGVEVDAAVGISAGAAFGCNYKSRQIGRALRYNKRFCRDRRYCSVWSLLTTGDLYNAKFAYDTLPHELDIFDTDTFASNPMPFYIGATNTETGKCEFHECSDGGELDILWMRASASMPIVSREVEIGGKFYLDGGMSDSIPLGFMEGLGYERNIVILTQPKGFVKQPNKMLPVIRRKYGKKRPNLVAAMEKRHDNYNAELSHIADMEAQGKAFVIRPPEALNIGSREKDPEELERVYAIGKRVGLNTLPSVRSFLAAGAL